MQRVELRLVSRNQHHAVSALHQLTAHRTTELPRRASYQHSASESRHPSTASTAAAVMDPVNTPLVCVMASPICLSTLALPFATITSRQW